MRRRVRAAARGAGTTVEYTRESANARFALSASGTFCWSCHVGAVETDYVWIETLGLAR